MFSPRAGVALAILLALVDVSDGEWDVAPFSF